ncbi:MAG: CopG family antitoxin [Acidimicrobiales bacterium]
MRQDEIDQAAEYYDTHDMCHLTESGEIDTSVSTGTTEVISVRLPVAVMDSIRSAAKTHGLRTSNLVREWLEERLAREGIDVEATVPVGALLAFVAERSVSHPQAS